MRAFEAHYTRAQLRGASGVLLISRIVPPPAAPSPGQPTFVAADPSEGPEILLALWDDGSVTGFAGHVDLGTGLRTALTQIVAEELDLLPDRVAMVMGSTSSVPNQGATIASASIQIHAVPLRQAAAQALAWVAAQGGWSSALAALGGQCLELNLRTDVAVKAPQDYRVVGQSTERVDIPAKAFGESTFVHDMRMPGMLHGRVIRPPYAGLDAGDFVGNTLEGVDEQSIAHIPGVVAVVVVRDFVGVVAEREEQAEAAMRELVVRWKPWPGMPGVDRTENALRSHPSTRRVLMDQGDVDAALASAATSMPRTYVWPYQLHASIGPSCAVASWTLPAGLQPLAHDEVATVWAGSQNPHVLRSDLARLMGVAPAQISVVRMEASGCYGRNCADDVAADALLLSRAVGRPVRVQLTREQDHLWEPKGAAQLMQVQGGLNDDGSPAAYDFQTSYPSNGAPTLALLLTGTVAATSQAFEMGDRTSVPPYAYDHMRVAANDMPPILRASWLRGVSALPNSFAHESYIDELATAAGVDPLDYRLRHLKDERAAELLRATAAKAGWIAHEQPQRQAGEGEILKGQGLAYARYIHSKFPGFGAAWAAWVADVEVNRRTGEVHVSRVVVGHDAGLMVNPAGVQHQVHGNVLQTTSRALKEEVPVDPVLGIPLAREWGSYPILHFREVPVVEVTLMPRQGEPPLGAGESSSVPGTAAIANAIFDATGVRFREPPFTAEKIRAALNPLPDASGVLGVLGAPAAGHAAASLRRDAALQIGLAGGPAAVPWIRRKGFWATAGALVAGVVGVGASLFGARTQIAPIAAPDIALFSKAAIARGKELAALGNCMTCHTVEGGAVNAGGRAMQTPFGVIHSTNITPDAKTGIGAWSFGAFQRAMREGISRDGRHLYPAFPYTSFSRMSDDDLMSLYAFLMTQPATSATTPAAQMAFPFGQRSLMGLWNALYLTPGAEPVADAARSAQWNRGAYLVNGVGHCGACHTTRNALGAEGTGIRYLGGAMVKGWEAPALNALGKSPVPWTEASLYQYLARGYSAEHGTAAGAMAPVVQQLQQVPQEDIRAMAHYLASLQPETSAQQADELAAQARERSRQAQVQLRGSRAQRMFEQACGACHHDGDGPRLFGANIPLALNTNLHSDRPDNLLRTIIEGSQDPAVVDNGFMPAFGDALDDRQIAELAGYMRQRFAPDKAAWGDLEQAAARVRATAAAR